MIYVLLRGRVGNQLFMYAAAKAVQKDNEPIVMDDYEVLKRGWVNSLPDYDLPDVTYVHTHKEMMKYGFTGVGIFMKFYHHFTRFQDFWKKHRFELKHKRFFSRRGLFLFENGYTDFERTTENVLLDGYFQSAKYFDSVKDRVLRDLALPEETLSAYPGLEEIRNRNTVCVSIKVEHNVGNSLYDVCNDGYWEEAIRTITEKVENPLFFICSDNVEYVKEHFIDTEKYDTVCQSRDFPVEVSLAVMSQCKHFVIGNTTFGWWAQYLCDYPEKTVIAPSRWMKVDMPIDIYEDNWTLIEV